MDPDFPTWAKAIGWLLIGSLALAMVAVLFHLV
jgi:hypothetical protein